MILTCHKCGREFETFSLRKARFCPPCRRERDTMRDIEYYRAHKGKINASRAERKEYVATPEFSAPGNDALIYHGVDVAVQETIHRLCKPLLEKIPGPVHIYTPEEVREYEQQNGLGWEAP